MSGIDLCNNESRVIPGRSRESGKQAEHDHYHCFIMYNVQEKHRNGRDKQAEGCRGVNNFKRKMHVQLYIVHTLKGVAIAKKIYQHSATHQKDY